MLYAFNYLRNSELEALCMTTSDALSYVLTRTSELSLLLSKQSLETISASFSGFGGIFYIDSAEIAYFSKSAACASVTFKIDGATI